MHKSVRELIWEAAKSLRIPVEAILCGIPLELGRRVINTVTIGPKLTVGGWIAPTGEGYYNIGKWRMPVDPELLESLIELLDDFEADLVIDERDHCTLLVHMEEATPELLEMFGKKYDELFF